MIYERENVCIPPQMKQSGSSFSLELELVFAFSMPFLDHNRQFDYMELIDSQ